MKEGKPLVHPYIPNSVPEVKKEMLEEVGVKNIEDLYTEIPDRLRFKRKLNLPEPFLSECELKKHVKEILEKNKTCDEYLNFLGGGCWQHYVPAVCDEIGGRTEFVTAYAGMEHADIGKWQAFFEFQSQIGELVKMDAVNVPSYSWGSAAGEAIRMASRMTARNEVLLPRTTAPERLEVIKGLCGNKDMPGGIEIILVEYDPQSGLVDLKDLKNKISSNTAAVYFENPSYLGFIESRGAEISKIAHDNGAESIAGVDPISLGIISAPPDYGADIVVGTAQPLGIHMNCGGGTVGFIASSDDERYMSEYPSWLTTIVDTIKEGEHGFSPCYMERTSYSERDEAKDWAGTTTALWAITAAVYMSLMGPWGFKEIGETIIQKSHYAAKRLSEIKGLKLLFTSSFFKEFALNFDGVRKTVKEINRSLLEHGIYGGKDISSEFPELGNSALYCVTEVHSKTDIDRLAKAMKEVVK